jgi:hypothetical protein
METPGCSTGTHLLRFKRGGGAAKMIKFEGRKGVEGPEPRHAETGF